MEKGSVYMDSAIKSYKSHEFYQRGYKDGYDAAFEVFKEQLMELHLHKPIQILVDAEIMDKFSEIDCE